MTRTRCIAAVFCLISAPVRAEDAASVAGVPVGVIVYDSVATSDAAAPLVVLPEAAALPAVPAIAPLTQSLASTRSSFPQPIVTEAVPSGAVLNPSSVVPQVNLAPGETVLQAIAVPSAIVRIPNPQPAYTLTSGPPPAARPSQRVAPQPVVDPVKGRLRDTPGWTGRREAPASIGCFPAGSCAVLNQR